MAKVAKKTEKTKNPNNRDKFVWEPEMLEFESEKKPRKAKEEE